MATTKEDDENQKSLKSEEYRQLFHLPPEELLIADFNCALQKKILLQGHMYLFERYVCFYSNIFGYEKKKIIPLKDVTCVRKARTASVFPNAIEIVSWGKKHFFASFLSRDEAFRLIIDGWVQHSSYAKLFLNSQETSLASLAMSPQRTTGAENGAVSQKAWQSPLLMTRLEAGGNYESRVDEMAAKIVASAGIEHGSSRAVSEHEEGDHSIENDEEETTSSSGSVGEHPSSVWEIEDTDAPPLEDSYKTVVECEFPVDVEEFFQLFFSNEAIGFAKDFHTKCGDDDVRCTQWAKHRHFGHARDISFRHPISFYFGLKSTYCHESQRFRVYRNNHLVLETTQQMTDIPYGDYFKVEVRWDVERLYGNGQCHSFVRVSLDVAFSKKTVWKGKIEQGTYEESKEAYTTWIQMARGVVRDMKSLAAKHLDGIDSTECITGHQVPSTAECSSSGEPLDRGEENSATSHELNTMNGVAETNINQRVLEFQTQPEWARKASSVLKNAVEVSQRGWQKLAASEWRKHTKLVLFMLAAAIIVSMQVRKLSFNSCVLGCKILGLGIMIDWRKHTKLVLFMLAAVIIFSMQIGIIITLMWPPSTKPAVSLPQYYHGRSSNMDSCSETLGWLERKFRHIKEEIAMTELRLHDLHHDLAALKAHAEQFQRRVISHTTSQIECQTPQCNGL